MILKFCTQYVSKFEKFSSNQWTRKGPFSFQFQRSEVPKIVQTTMQLCLFHRLASLCSKSFRLGFSSTWTENFQMYKLGLEKAEEPETKLPTFAESEKAREFLKNIYFCFIDYTKAFECVNHNKLWKILQEMGIPDHLICLLRSLYAGQELDMKQWTGSKLGKEHVKAVYCHPAYLICRVHHEKRWGGWSTGWNQDCREKYQ